MKPMDITPLQENNPSQFYLIFGKKLKDMMTAMGWKKGSSILISRHGAGFFINCVSGKQAEEVEKYLLKIAGITGQQAMESPMEAFDEKKDAKKKGGKR